MSETAVLDLLLRNHAIGLPYPAPILADMEADPAKYGNTVHIEVRKSSDSRGLAAPASKVPGLPLRTHSCLHVAVATAKESAVADALTEGFPSDLLAGGEFPTIHWPLHSTQPEARIRLLLA